MPKSEHTMKTLKRAGVGGTSTVKLQEAAWELPPDGVNPVAARRWRKHGRHGLRSYEGGGFPPPGARPAEFSGFDKASPVVNRPRQ